MAQVCLTQMHGASSSVGASGWSQEIIHKMMRDSYIYPHLYVKMYQPRCLSHPVDTRNYLVKLRKIGTFPLQIYSKSWFNLRD